MSTLMDASTQWATRPADQRFTSLSEMHAFAQSVRANSTAKVLPNRSMSAEPLLLEGGKGYSERGLVVRGPNGNPVAPTHWAFGQLAQRIGAPAAYLRDLPAPIAADCINWGFRQRDVEELGILLHRPTPEAASMTAVTGPNYGRVWNESVISQCVRTFGDGRTGTFRIPGEFGEQVEITKANTTLFASDRDCFIFLADEENRIEIPNRRNGEAGTLARGFFIRNSDVGAAALVIDTFLFDYVCMNRIVWGVSEHVKHSIRHTSGAPARFLEEVAPALELMHDDKTQSIVTAIEAARANRIGDKEAVQVFLNKRFGLSLKQATGIMAAHETDEGRPIESLWDAATGVTAYARGLDHQDSRFALEQIGGKILDMAA